MKTSVVTEWLSGCSGCHIAIVDLHEKLLRLVEEIEIIRSPVLMDEKLYPKARVGIVEGAVRSSHDRDALLRLRDSVDILVAFGTCAVYGGPSGIGWLYDKKDVFDTSFASGPTNTPGQQPDDRVPRLETSVYPIDEVVTVDFYLPGCPPHPYFIAASLRALLGAPAPELSHRSVCSDCNRRMEKRERVVFKPGATSGEEGMCFLSQGILCLGSVTLNRCQAQCPNAGVVCTGCSGPSLEVLTEPHLDIRNQLAQRMALLGGMDKQEIVAYLERNANTFYAYAMASPVVYKKPTAQLREWAGPPTVTKTR